jgi:Fe-S-cluster containining protein
MTTTRQLILARVEKVLSYYSCPDKCKGACCRFSSVRIGRDEYPEILEDVDDESRQIIESNVVELPSTCKKGDLDYDTECIYQINVTNQTGDHCPLLEKKSRCRIYGNRPRICKEYPIEGLGTKLRICPMGFEILLDYINFAESIGADMSCIDMQKYIKSSKESNPDLFSNVNIIIPDYFLKYLEITTPKQRKQNRKNLINRRRNRK